jgi:hypothetical protein
VNCGNFEHDFFALRQVLDFKRRQWRVVFWRSAASQKRCLPAV